MYARVYVYKKSCCFVLQDSKVAGEMTVHPEHLVQRAVTACRDHKDHVAKPGRRDQLVQLGLEVKTVRPDQLDHKVKEVKQAMRDHWGRLALLDQPDRRDKEAIAEKLAQQDHLVCII